MSLGLDDFLRRGRVSLLAVGAHLAEHGHGIEPDLDALQLQLVVDLGNGETLDVDGAAVGLERDLFTLAVLCGSDQYSIPRTFVVSS